MPLDIVQAYLGRLTPGMVNGLEVLIGGMEAEDHLYQISDIAAVLGGSEASRYVASLQELRETTREMTANPETPASKARKEAAQQAQIEGFKAVLAMAEKRCQQGG